MAHVSTVGVLALVITVPASVAVADLLLRSSIKPAPFFHCAIVRLAVVYTFLIAEIARHALLTDLSTGLSSRFVYMPPLAIVIANPRSASDSCESLPQDVGRRFQFCGNDLSNISFSCSVSCAVAFLSLFNVQEESLSNQEYLMNVDITEESQYCVAGSAICH